MLDNTPFFFNNRSIRNLGGIFFRKKFIPYRYCWFFLSISTNLMLCVNKLPLPLV